MVTWISKDLAMAIHDRQIAEYGGSEGVRDEALLEFALARPEQLAAHGDPAPDIADLAASLAFGLARNHPFVDGNKRTAHVCYRAFLALNGVELASTMEDMYINILALAEGRLTSAEFAAWLRESLRPQVLHESRAAYR